MIVDVDGLEARARVYELADGLGIYSNPLRAEMADEPGRAIAVLELALSSPRIRNRAAFAIARWRAGADPRSDSERARLRLDRELVDAELAPAGAPTIEALELAWSLEDEGSLVAMPMLAMMVVAIERAGGCRAALYRPELFGG